VFSLFSICYKTQAKACGYQNRTFARASDCYNIKEQCRKINLYLDYEDALTLADDDINENWEIYREKFLRGDFP